QRQWRKFLGMALKLAFSELAPTHFARVTIPGMAPRQLSRRVNNALRCLKRRNRDLQYGLFHEWTDVEGTGHHVHLLLRTRGVVTREVLKALLQRRLSVPVSVYCRPVRSAQGS